MINKKKNSFKKNSKSFFFASFFLSRETSQNVYFLYDFCRKIDDMADKGNRFDFIKLSILEKELKKKKLSNNPFLTNINPLIKSKLISKKSIQELIKGVRLDTRKINIKNTKQLLNYAYLVAGTVGMMMCRLLKNSDAYAYKYAVDLGIAMQLTNIMRDILEDAKLNRIYIPKSWFSLKLLKIINQDQQHKKNLILASKKLFILSERYYESALNGLAFLPLRSRFAILTALMIYRHIGIKIVKKNFSNLYKREIVSHKEKLVCLIKIIFIFLTSVKIHRKNFKHNSKLHLFIKKSYLLKKIKYD